MGLFRQAEAEEFVRAGFDAAGVPVSPEEMDRLLILAGRWPFFLELACYHLFESKVKQNDEWEADFRQGAESHLRAMWDARTPDERKALLCVLNMERRSPDTRVCRDLERGGVLVKDDQSTLGYRLFSKAFEEIVRSQRDSVREPFGFLVTAQFRW